MMQIEQPSLFETQKAEGYPIIMHGNWKGFEAFALVDTPEDKERLEKQGYIKIEK